MPGIKRGEENGPSLINWFTELGGFKIDSAAVGFRILDITAGLPGTQIFPAVSGTYEDVTSGAGHYAVGHYYAYDNGNSQGWTPGLSEPIGTHRILWRFKVYPSDNFIEGAEDFEVLFQSAGGPGLGYCTVQDLRDEGLTDPPYDDAYLEELIQLISRYIDKITGQWFENRTKTFLMDGRFPQFLPLSVPIIEITKLTINTDDTDGGTEVDPADFVVYSQDTEDGEGSPGIKLRRKRSGSIYSTIGSLTFKRGYQNQMVEGKFGYMEDDDTPALIKRACKILCIVNAPLLGDEEAATPSSAFIKRETTDRHSYELGNVGDPMNSLSGDPRADRILRMYRAATGIQIAGIGWPK